MKNLTKKGLSITLPMARGTATMVGLAEMLAVAFGVGTAALAAVPGDPFKLGGINTIAKLTQLVGSADSALLRIANDSKGANATALDLQVDPKKPPMKVSSFAKVERLNADLLDGKSKDQFANGVGGTAVDSDNLDGKDSTAFFSGKTYIVSEEREGPGSSFGMEKSAYCDEGDKILGGGSVMSAEDDFILDAPSTAGTSERWSVIILDHYAPTKIVVKALCADFPPLR